MVVVRLKDVIMLCVDSIFKANLMSRQAIELRIGSASLDTHSITPTLKNYVFQSILTLFSDSLLSISEIVRWPQASSGWLKCFFGLASNREEKPTK